MEVSTILGKLAFGQILKEFKKRSSEAVTKNFDFRKICQEYNIPLGLEDNAKILYVQTLVQLAVKSEECKEWTELFIIESVFDSFIESQNIDQRETFERELNCQLHTGNVHNLKNNNSVPDYILRDFYLTYSNLIRRIETPTQKKASLERKEILEEVGKLAKNTKSGDDRVAVGQIIQEFNSASFKLAEAPNTFNDLPGSHIERNETTDLINWIEEDQELEGERNPIALLVGNAGTGKTTILKDLLVKLQDDKIPVLGIKADRFYAESRKQLEEKLNLEHKLIRSFESILDAEGKLVVIIDQVDALSQSLSARREYLDTINQLVRDASRLVGIRIIISIRTFDLEYDTDFNFYKNQKELKVTNLTKPQVEEVLKKIEFPLSQISETLFDLIKVPLHLNVFCKVYDKGRSYQNIKTLNDLYGELWQEKIVKIIDNSKTNPKRCKKLLFKLAKKMNDGQWITLNSARYKDSFINELNYLQSVGLISLTKDEIQFFHQTFYDFCFAKRFVEKNQSLTEFILEKNQSLFVRSALKMILDFQRSYDIDAYIENYRQIFAKEEYRFHIKLLLINLLGFIEKPNEKEKAFVSGILLKRPETSYVFIESALSSEWFKFLYESSNVFADIFNVRQENELFEIVQTEQKMDFHNFWYQFFRKHIVNHSEEILILLNKQPESEDKYNLISRCLFIVEKWSKKLTFNLFEKCISEEKIDGFARYKILEDICKYDFDYAVNCYSEVLDERINQASKDKKTEENSAIEYLLMPFKGIPNFTHDDENLFKVMRKTNPKKFFEFAFQYCEVLIKNLERNYYNELYPNYKCIKDSAFNGFYFDDVNGHSTNQKILFKETALAIKVLAKSDVDSFSKFLEKYLDTRYISIIKLIVYGLIEKPKRYENEITLLIKNIERKGGFLIDDHFYLFIRELLKVSFSSLSIEHQTYIVSFLCGSDRIYRKKISQGLCAEVKLRHLKYFEKEKYKFIQALPKGEIVKFKILKKTFQELERKFGKIKGEDRGHVTACAVRPPINLPSCNKMTFSDWKESFLTYTSNDHRNWINGIGGIEQHASQFSIVVSQDANSYTDFIDELIYDERVPREYIVQGMMGLMNGECNFNRFKQLFQKVNKLELDYYQKYTTVRLTDYYLKNNSVDDSILHFLLETAINAGYKVSHEKGQDVVSNGIGSVRGAAIYRLTQINNKPEYEHRIFEALDKVVNEGNEPLIVTIVANLANLIQLNKEKTIKVIINATSNMTADIANNAMHSLKYLVQTDFDSVKRIVDNCFQFEETHKDLVEVLGLAWLSNVEAEGSLKSLLEKSSVARENVILFAEDYIFSIEKDIRNKARYLLNLYLDSVEDVVISSYSSMFVRFEPQLFTELLPQLTLYSQSNVVTKSPYSFLGYLSKCATKYPHECIALVEKFSLWEYNERFYNGNSPVNVVVSAINSIDGITVKEIKDRDYIEKGVELFDMMLKDSRIRSSADKALEVIN